MQVHLTASMAYKSKMAVAYGIYGVPWEVCILDIQIASD